MILVDTSILIDFARKKNKSKSRFHSLIEKDMQFGISVITHYEFGVGLTSRHKKLWDFINTEFAILPLSKMISEKAILINNKLKKENQRIDIADLMIGATAVSYNIGLSTLNASHFARIEDLQIIL